MPYRDEEDARFGRRRPDRERPGRGGRALLVLLTVAVGGLGTWVLVANTLFKDTTGPRADVAAALLAARDGAPPTLSILKVASVTAMPDGPLPQAAPAAEPAPPLALAPAPTPAPAPAPVPVPEIAVAAPSAATVARSEATDIDPPASPGPMVLAAVSAGEETGSLAAPPLAAVPDEVDEEAGTPLAGLVPLPRQRPSAEAIPLPRPRPEIETDVSAPAPTLEPWQIDRNQPL
ncbi:hypothetical protein PQJ75_24515 [Rhodoplanes sp. TEM]|uniref:Uncharacterized protein n=1 Tax=Rhodoplanes tepidamans TaxID=200616 RepID=A0ABT5JCD8_RHOTP|nr:MULTISPECIES: hypothetical protein [Rhodoplanes]MDC7787304.1 hypothetical protein [Rhodoplanes tepidamans]MDC7986906.1 hypothetical protein [Rhodoplanes sp. TEM]MDQ0358215.1 hypothetical protein [Rhodoplanes tepidamans]